MAERKPSPTSRRATIALLLVILTSAGAGVVIHVSQKATARSIRGLSTAFMHEVAARAQAATLAYLETGPRSLELPDGSFSSKRTRRRDHAATLWVTLLCLVLAIGLAAALEQNWPAVGRAAHSLKGSSSSLGLVAVAALGKQLEQLCEAPAGAALEAAARRMEQELERAHALLEHERGRGRLRRPQRVAGT